MKIVFIQRVLPRYRQALFDELRKQSIAQGHSFSLWVSLPHAIFERRGTSGSLDWVDWVRCVSLPDRLGSIEFQFLPWRKLIAADVVIVPDSARCLSNLAVLVLRRLLGRQVLTWGHGINFQPDSFSKRYEKLRLWLFRIADRNLLYTDACLKFMGEAGYPLDRLGVTENAVDTTAAQGLYSQHPEVLAFRQKHGLGQFPCIVFLGSWYARKRPEVVIEIGEALRKQVPDAKVIVIGGGDSLPLLQSLAASFPWLIITGPLHGRDLYVALAAANCLAVSGVAGLNVLDAMAVGLPIVLPKRVDHSPEVAYVQHNVNGLIVEDSVQHLADACAELINNPAQRATFSAGALITSRSRTIDSMAANFLRFAQKTVFPRTNQPVVFVYQRMLPYHHARFFAVASALAKQGRQAVALEVADFDSSYGAISAPAGKNKNQSLSIECLFPGKDYLELDKKAVAAKVALRLQVLNPDIVFSPAPAFAEGAGAMHYKVNHGGRLVLMDDAWSLTERQSSVKRIVKRLLYRCYDGGFFPSLLHGNYFNDLSIPFDRQHYAVDVVADNDNNVCIETAALCALQSPYLLYVGRLIARKNLDVLIHAFAQLQHPDLKLVVIGDGPERARLEANAQQEGIKDSIKWLGTLDNAISRAWMQHSVAVVVPSAFEQWGLVVNEAWQAGTLVVGSDTVGALKSAYQADMHWMMSPPGDVEALQIVLSQILALTSVERTDLLAKLESVHLAYSMAEHVKSTLQLINMVPRKQVGWFTRKLALAWQGNVAVW
ncbi:glycosyltransferase family 4 protein [Crenothrix sp.]|uniref:glycosyltransferase family 4 protein n=1 Tax=Crenothrix sp. TaxID=3100433 RepID=UPI00374DFB79